MATAGGQQRASPPLGPTPGALQAVQPHQHQRPMCSISGGRSCSSSKRGSAVVGSRHGAMAATAVFTAVLAWGATPAKAQGAVVGTPAPPAPPAPSLIAFAETETGLSQGAIIGICFGSVIGGVLLIVGCCLVIRRLRKGACWAPDVEKALNVAGPENLVPSKHRAADLDPIDEGGTLEMSKIGDYVSPDLPDSMLQRGSHCDPRPSVDATGHQSVDGAAPLSAAGSGRAQGFNKTSMLLKWLDGLEGDAGVSAQAVSQGDQKLLAAGTTSSSAPPLPISTRTLSGHVTSGDPPAKLGAGVKGSGVGSGRFGSALMQQLFSGSERRGSRAHTGAVVGMSFHRLPPSTTASPAPSVAGSSRILLSNFKHRSDELDGFFDGPQGGLSSEQMSVPLSLSLSHRGGSGGGAPADGTHGGQGAAFSTPRDRADVGGRASSLARVSAHRAGGISFARLGSSSSLPRLPHTQGSAGLPHAQGPAGGVSLTGAGSTVAAAAAVLASLAAAAGAGAGVGGVGDVGGAPLPPRPPSARIPGSASAQLPASQGVDSTPQLSAATSPPAAAAAAGPGANTTSDALPGGFTFSPTAASSAVTPLDHPAPPAPSQPGPPGAAAVGAVALGTAPAPSQPDLASAAPVGSWLDSHRSQSLGFFAVPSPLMQGTGLLGAPMSGEAAGEAAGGAATGPTGGPGMGLGVGAAMGHGAGVVAGAQGVQAVAGN